MLLQTILEGLGTLLVLVCAVGIRRGAVRQQLFPFSRQGQRWDDENADCKN